MNLPDPVLRYVVEARPAHDAIRRALIQMSAFLLKRLTVGRGGIVDFEPLEAARAGFAEAVDSLRSLPAPLAAAHHRMHLEGAASALERALAATLSRADPDGRALFPLLEDAERHWRAASRALPGFETVDLSQACCAAHIQQAAPTLRCFG